MLARSVISVMVAVAFVVVAAGRPDWRSVSRQPGDAVSGLPIRMQIESMIAPESDRWSVLVRSIEGNVVYEHNPDLHLQPASNMKVLTTAAALDALGPGWTTRTSVYATAEPAEDGTVDGSIVLYGRGDPNLSGRLSETGDVLEPFRQLAASVRARGLVRVTGDLVADASYLSGPPHGSGWAWQDLQWHFGTEVSALSFNDNLASINVLPAEAGSSCLVTVTPDVGHVRIQNTATTGGSARISVHRGVDSSVVEVAGSLPVGHPGVTVEIAVHNPPAYAAEAFRQALAEAGVTIEGGIRVLNAYDERPGELELARLHEVASLESRPLADLVRTTNKLSQNLHAELILRIMGREAGPAGVPCDEAGLSVVRGFLERIGGASEGMVLRDGSGLSRLDRISASNLDAVMRTMTIHESRAAFIDSLPIAGVDGTMKHRLGGIAVWAKTGSLATAKSISGVVTAQSGRRFVVTMIYNDPGGRTWSAIPTMDRVIQLLARSG